MPELNSLKPGDKVWVFRPLQQDVHLTYVRRMCYGIGVIETDDMGRFDIHTGRGVGLTTWLLFPMPLVIRIPEEAYIH